MKVRSEVNAYCYSADANDFHLFWLIEFSKFISGGEGKLRKIQFSRFSIFLFFLLAEPTMYALWCKSSFLWRKILEQNWNFTCVWTVKCCETIHATRKFFKCKNDHHPSKGEKDNGTPSFGKNHLLGNEFWVCRVQKLSPYCSLIHKD